MRCLLASGVLAIALAELSTPAFAVEVAKRKIEPTVSIDHSSSKAFKKATISVPSQPKPIARSGSKANLGSKRQDGDDSPSINPQPLPPAAGISSKTNLGSKRQDDEGPSINPQPLPPAPPSHPTAPQ